MDFTGDSPRKTDKHPIDLKPLRRFRFWTQKYAISPQSRDKIQDGNVGLRLVSPNSDPISELGTKFWPRKPKLVSRPLPNGENKTQWLNSFFWNCPNGKTNFFDKQDSALCAWILPHELQNARTALERKAFKIPTTVPARSYSGYVND